MTLLAIFEALVGANAIWETTVKHRNLHLYKCATLRIGVFLLPKRRSFRCVFSTYSSKAESREGIKK